MSHPTELDYSGLWAWRKSQSVDLVLDGAHPLEVLSIGLDVSNAVEREVARD